MIQALEHGLIDDLGDAKSVYFAIALIKDYGLTAIEDALPENCLRKYLVGIHLPTPPDILRRLLTIKKESAAFVDVRIHRAKSNYHPKVYLIENKRGIYRAYVGSANATKGGFLNNIELSLKTDDQQECRDIKRWFEVLFEAAKEFNELDIRRYEETYKRNKLLAATQKSNIDSLFDETPQPGQTLIVNDGQFFRQSDFDAFAPDTQDDVSEEAVRRRGEVRKRLIELNDRIFRHFQEYGIHNLNLPRRQQEYTSQHFHSRGHDHIDKEAIWLNYGKSVDELNVYDGAHRKFVDHERIQVILRNTSIEAYIGVWLYIGKEGGSIHDRRRLRSNLDAHDFRIRLFDYVTALGGMYKIEIGQNVLSVSDIKSSQDLVMFLLNDHSKHELIIGRNYHPNDPQISDQTIKETVLEEFSRLYRLYELIKTG